MQAATGHGPYSGVGLYGPGRQWTKLAANQAAKDKDSARAIDDQVVIVVQNTATGEVRACGDLTGYCIGMNPWKAPLLASQVSPVKMTSHVEADEPDATVERRVRPEKACKRRKHSEAGSGGQAHEPGETSGSTQS
jgi:hypothetical protein